ncbi:MFS general substrate transporter [Sistotremastrum niveocremeum HHB9708]|uniref:MFS general substrate transporter n=2 Tax=Sistotremastraceae TaxID=3402574 RepID=A0A165AJL5_9AGAM|nr:MFS general substrate transporter [Sistotremastrum niveocremeum HHB9708]KZT44001.1 MFS general substrate transporter [Sistotremastrum suecicum HHB10207 ss-3]
MTSMSQPGQAQSYVESDSKDQVEIPDVDALELPDAIPLEKDLSGLTAVSETTCVQQVVPTHKDSEIDFPDGGFRAWLIVFGGACATFSSFGFVNAWGVFQAYYQETLLPDVPASTIAWIGSTQYALIFATGLPLGRLFDLGIYHTPLMVASVIQVVSTLLVGQCKEYWQFFLCQGVAVGLASGCIFGPTLAVVSHWFKKRRSTAYGILAVGSSVGGTVYPIMVRNLITKIGFPWTMRVLALILICSTGVVNLVMRRRLSPVKMPGGLFNPKAFKYPPFTLYTLACFVCFLGLYTVLTYIDVSASLAGIDPAFGVYLLAIANFSSAFGRVLTGILSDKMGCLTIMIPGTALAAVLTYAWPFARSLGPLIAIAILYGFSSGVFVGLVAIPLVHMGETADAGRRTGMLFTILSVAALVGPPISGAVAERSGGYEAVGFYAGSAILVSVALMIEVRYLITGHLFKGKF